jgi:hypothetical protein
MANDSTFYIPGVSHKSGTIWQNESGLYAQNVFSVSTITTDTRMQTRYPGSYDNMNGVRRYCVACVYDDLL